MTEHHSCGALLKQIHDEMEKQANNTLRAQELTMAQVVALHALQDCEEKQMSLKELERCLHVAQSTAAGTVARLEQKGFVEGFGDPSDKRIKMVRLTPTGIACCQVAQLGMDAAETELLSGLTETEQDIFYSLLLKVRNTLK